MTAHENNDDERRNVAAHTRSDIPIHIRTRLRTMVTAIMCRCSKAQTATDRVSKKPGCCPYLPEDEVEPLSIVCVLGCA